jgi:transposase InsO family protein
MSQLVNGSVPEDGEVIFDGGGGPKRSPGGASEGPPSPSAPLSEGVSLPIPSVSPTAEGIAPAPITPSAASSPAAPLPEAPSVPPEVAPREVADETPLTPAPGELDDGDLPPDWQPVDRDEIPGPSGLRQEPYLDQEVEREVQRLAFRRRKGPRLAKPDPGVKSPTTMTPEQRLLILDTWRRSGLPAGDFAEMVGMSKHTLYSWKSRFEKDGPAGLMDKPKGQKGSKLPDITRRSILMLKEDHPDWGCQRISDVLMRGPGLSASPTTVSRILYEEGYELVEQPTEPHPDKVRRFERATPNQLWQTDLFTFVLKRQNRRVYLVAFMDDHSRYIVSYGLHASQSAALVIEVLRAGIASCGASQEVLTDNGSQYVTWRGTSAFAKELQRRGIRHVVASPRRPQTLGKVERFWGTLWRECLQAAVFIDLADAQARIGHFIDYYNYRRPHQGLDGLVPADRFFQLAPEVRKTMEARVHANALDLARQGLPKAPFYLTGQAGGKTFSVHAEGERVILSREGQTRQEIDLVAPAAPPQSMPAPACSQGIVASDGIGEEQPPPPGLSMLDEGMHRIIQSMNASGESRQEGGTA